MKMAIAGVRMAKAGASHSDGVQAFRLPNQPGDIAAAHRMFPQPFSAAQ
ncbi:MAG: hypothetical protein ACR2KT_05010 [Methylocella sp.]